MLMEVAIRFELQDGEWVSSKSVEQSVPQRIPFSIQLLPFEESLAQSDDFLLHSLDASMSSVRSRILATPACSKKKKETSFEEIWSALKPRSPGFNYFPKASENSTPATETKDESKHKVVSTSDIVPRREHGTTSETTPECELVSTIETTPKTDPVVKSEDTRRRSDVPKCSSLFASAKGEAVALSDQATSRAKSLLFEEVDCIPPIKRKAETSGSGFRKKAATSFKVPFRGFKPPTQKTKVDFKPPIMTPETSMSGHDSGELRRATLTGPPAPYKSSWRPLDTNLLPKGDSTNQITIPDSPLSELTDLQFDSSSAILPSVSQRFVFANGTNSRRLHEQMIERGLNVSVHWIDQHYRWIIWTLSALPADHRKSLFNPETILQELQYRYHTESKKNGVSCLQELVKKHGWSSDQMVLLIADIQPNGGNKTQSTRLELSDGWTSVFIEVDQALQSKINSNRIRIGSFLAVHHLQVIRRQTDQPITLQLQHNRCTPALEGTKLGIHEDEQFFVPLSWIHVNGGNISRTWVYICRKYPLTFKHKSPDGRYSDLTVSQYEHKMQVFNQRLEEIRIKATAEVKKKQFEFFSAVVESKKAGQEVDEMEWLFAMELLEQEVDQSLLADDALRDLEQFRQVHKESIVRCIETTVDRLIREQGIFTPSGDPHIDLLVSEVSRSGTKGGMNGQLTIWMRDLEDEVDFKEGEIFEFRELSVGRYPAPNGLMSLRATRETTYRRVCHLEDLAGGLSVFYSPRAPVQDLTCLKNGDPFDFVAFVVKDSDGKCLICRSAEMPEAEQPMIKICLLEADPLDKTKAGEVLLLKDLAPGTCSSSENLVLAFVTQRTSFTSIKEHRNQEILLQLLN